MPEAIDLNPKAIFEKIDACPPLMRANEAGHYAGKEVFWLLNYANASLTEGGQAHLVLRFDPHDVRMIVGDAPLSGFPGLISAHAGEVFLVRGQIIKIDSLCIALKIKELVFANTLEAAH